MSSSLGSEGSLFRVLVLRSVNDVTGRSCETNRAERLSDLGESIMSK